MIRAAHRVIETPLDGAARAVGHLVLSQPPPSLNNAFVNGKRGRFKSERYKAWRTLAAIELRQQPSWHVPGPVRISLTFGKSSADLDNLQKGAIDSLVAAARIHDDRNVRELHARFGDVTGVVIEIVRAA